jgi:hypothetical protein
MDDESQKPTHKVDKEDSRLLLSAWVSSSYLMRKFSAPNLCRIMLVRCVICFQKAGPKYNRAKFAIKSSWLLLGDTPKAGCAAKCAYN